MKCRYLACDICGHNIENRREIGYKIKKKLFFLDNTWKNMDVCQDCMRKIIEKVKEAQNGNSGNTE